MKKTITITGLLFTIVLILPRKTRANEVIPDTVRVGIYITSIHNIDFVNREYSVSFWLWLKYKNKKLNFPKYLEIPNAKSHTCEFADTDSSKEEISMLMKIQCVMKDSWRVEKFPFDKQMLRLTIENSQYDKDSLIFVPDSVGEHFDRRINYGLAGWTIDSFRIFTGNSVYKTSFGDTPFRDSVLYSAYKVRMAIVRKTPVRLFCKIFMGMYIAFLITYICFYIRPGNFDSRFQLSVGALFATIGNKYIVESSLPDSTTFTLVDALHTLTLFFILITIACTIVSLRIGRNNKSYNARTFDLIAAQVILVIYGAANAWFISRAM
jgi:hypothetical protein